MAAYHDSMKSACCLIFLVAGLVVTGCGKHDDSSTTSTTVTSVNNSQPPPAATGYAGTLVNAQQAAVKTVDLVSLNQAVQLFNVQEGRFPTDLNELVSKQYIGKLPAAPNGMKLVYDSTQGKVTAARQ
jgi:stage V sporulation protein SpoVS